MNFQKREFFPKMQKPIQDFSQCVCFFLYNIIVPIPQTQTKDTESDIVAVSDFIVDQAALYLNTNKSGDSVTVTTKNAGKIDGKTSLVKCLCFKASL